MEKTAVTWSVEDLRKSFPSIDFPEYQREPNLWSLTAKQRLIDSMVRSFDIAPLYLYRHESGSIDCVDGRQRIGTIMSFLGINEGDPHDKFSFKILNEIYEDEPSHFEPLEGKTYEEICRLRDESAEKDESDDPNAELVRQFLDRLHHYRLNIVMLSDSERPEEFNLQFTRLNLGAIINSGEKLHAMVGELRDECFTGLGKHPFLQQTDIPTRRFAQEQVAAQILAQVFSLLESDTLESDTLESDTYARTRHIDLQRQFKLKSRLDEDQRKAIKRVSQLLDLLGPAFKEMNVLRNRAITVSTVLLAWKLDLKTAEEAEGVASFVNEFVRRLGWQSRKGLDVDPEYRYLTDFQRHVTQASAESSAVAARAGVFEVEINRWMETQRLRGDLEYQERTDRDPRTESLQ